MDEVDSGGIYVVFGVMLGVSVGVEEVCEVTSIDESVVSLELVNSELDP